MFDVGQDAVVMENFGRRSGDAAESASALPLSLHLCISPDDIVHLGD
jgi:hypothetical protein